MAISNDSLLVLLQNVGSKLNQIMNYILNLEKTYTSKYNKLSDEISTVSGHVDSSQVIDSGLAIIFKSSTTKPATPYGGIYDFDENILTKAPSGWVLDQSTLEGLIWVSIGKIKSGLDFVWTIPMCISNKPADVLIQTSKILTIFKQSDLKPDTPEGGNYNFTTNLFVTPVGWTEDPDSLGGNIWESIGNVYDTDDSIIHWSTPFCANGMPGSAALTKVYVALIYKQSDHFPVTPTGGSYDFETETLTEPEGWTKNTLSGEDAYYSMRVFYNNSVKTEWSEPKLAVNSSVVLTYPLLEVIASQLKLESNEIEIMAKHIQLLHEDLEIIGLNMTVTEDNLNVIAGKINLNATQLETVAKKVSLSTELLDAVAKNVNLSTENLVTVAKKVKLDTDDLETVAKNILLTSNELSTIAGNIHITAAEDLEAIAKNIQLNGDNIRFISNRVAEMKVEEFGDVLSAIGIDKNGVNIVGKELSYKGSINDTNSVFQCNENGSGHIAKGNISWDESGNVKFKDNVKFSWTNVVDRDTLLNGLYTGIQTLYYLSSNGTKPDAPTAKVSSKSISPNTWTTDIPTWVENNTTLKYYQCNLILTKEGTYSWSIVSEYNDSSVSTQITKNTITSDYVNALELKVNVANVSGTLTIGDNIGVTDDFKKSITGRGISTTTITYLIGNSGTTPPDGNWKSSTSELTLTKGSYLWIKTYITYTDDKDPKTSYSIQYIPKDGTSITGNNGNDGNDGESVSGIYIKYINWNSSLGLTNSTTLPPGISWSDSVPDLSKLTQETKSYTYIWRRIDTLYSGSKGYVEGIPTYDAEMTTFAGPSQVTTIGDDGIKITATTSSTDYFLKLNSTSGIDLGQNSTTLAHFGTDGIWLGKDKDNKAFYVDNSGKGYFAGDLIIGGKITSDGISGGENFSDFYTYNNGTLTFNSNVVVASTSASRGIADTTITYQVGTDGTTPPNGNWEESTENLNLVQGSYLWIKTYITYTDDKDPKTSYTILYIPKDGASGGGGGNGNDGKDGTSVTSVSIQYINWNSSSGLTNDTKLPSGISWSSSIPDLSNLSFILKDYKYIWRRINTTYSTLETVNGTPVYDAEMTIAAGPSQVIKMNDDGIQIYSKKDYTANVGTYLSLTSTGTSGIDLIDNSKTVAHFGNDSLWLGNKENNSKHAIAVNENGSGDIAYGKISWNESGNVTLGEGVTISWDKVTGDKPSTYTILLYTDGKYYWYKDNEKTNVLAEGKDGTSVTIKGSKDSYTELPTSGNGGDGWLIDGFLWTYTGTSEITASDLSHDKGTKYNGFENVGQIKGDPGTNATLYYIHYVYCSDKNTGADYSTSEANDYIGIYVDIDKEDASTFAAANAKTAGTGGCISSIVWSKIKGESGTSVKVKYNDSASDADSHLTFKPGDKYMNTSSDGTTWNGWVLIVGEKGDPGINGEYTDFSFNISKSLTAYDTPSSDGDSGNCYFKEWQDAPEAVTAEYPYLWMRSIKYTYNTSSNKYEAGTAYYSRITGEKGPQGNSITGPAGASKTTKKWYYVSTSGIDVNPFRTAPTANNINAGTGSIPGTDWSETIDFTTVKTILDHNNDSKNADNKWGYEIWTVTQIITTTANGSNTYSYSGCQKDEYSSRLGTLSTYFGDTGIYTGTLTADLINGFTVNADDISCDTLSVKKINGYDVSSMFTSEDTIGGGTVGGWNIADSSIDKLNFTSDYGEINSSSLYPINFSLIGLYSNSNKISILKGTKYYTANNDKGTCMATDAYALELTSDGLKTSKGLNAYGIKSIITNQINTDGSGFLASNNIIWDSEGNLTMNNLSFGEIGSNVPENVKSIIKSFNAIGIYSYDKALDKIFEAISKFDNNNKTWTDSDWKSEWLLDSSNILGGYDFNDDCKLNVADVQKFINLTKNYKNNFNGYPIPDHITAIIKAFNNIGVYSYQDALHKINIAIAMYDNEEWMDFNKLNYDNENYNGYDFNQDGNNINAADVQSFINLIVDNKYHNYDYREYFSYNTLSLYLENNHILTCSMINYSYNSGPGLRIGYSIKNDKSFNFSKYSNAINSNGSGFLADGIINWNNDNEDEEFYLNINDLKFSKNGTITLSTILTYDTDAGLCLNDLNFDINGFSLNTDLLKYDNTNSDVLSIAGAEFSKNTSTLILEGSVNKISEGAISSTNTSSVNTNSGLNIKTENINFDTNSIITKAVFYLHSDIRNKNIIEDIQINLNDISQSPIFKYISKDDISNKIKIGTSALYWEEICPELISYVDDKLVLDYIGLNTVSVISLARIVKEQERRIKELESKLKL